MVTYSVLRRRRPQVSVTSLGIVAPLYSMLKSRDRHRRLQLFYYLVGAAPLWRYGALAKNDAVAKAVDGSVSTTNQGVANRGLLDA